MTLRIASLRIDPVSRALERRLVGALQILLEARKGLGPAGANVPGGPAFPQDDDGGRAAGQEPVDELGAQRLDARVADVVEEREVVDEARGLPPGRPQRRTGAARAGGRGP